MPLAPEYGDQVKSKIADLKNVGARPGSSITAALFLKEFVEKVGWTADSEGGEGRERKQYLKLLSGPVPLLSNCCFRSLLPYC